jgi:hypothetical protein
VLNWKKEEHIQTSTTITKRNKDIYIYIYKNEDEVNNKIGNLKNDI